MSIAECSLSLTDGVIRFKEEAKSLCTRATGPVINSAPSRRNRPALRDWKETVARTVFGEHRGR